MQLTFGSVCSGIGAPEVAWQPLGWRCAFVSEIDPFPRAVLGHRLGAGTKNGPALFGDFTKIGAADVEPIDLLVGGTPCQSFSVAGKRLGLDDPRGNLAIEFLALARRLRPRWLVWENVPGVRSSWSGAPDNPFGEDDEPGRELVCEEDSDFAAFLGLLSECGYGWAYRSLDAQFAGVPQRRERVILVGYLGDWRRAAAVLFEPESLRGDSPPRREAGQRVARPIAAGSERGSGYRNDADTADNLIAFGGNDTRGPIDVATACNAHGGTHGRLDFESETFITHAVFDPNQITSAANRSQPTPELCHTLPATPIAPVAYRTSPNCGAWETGDRTDALTTGTDPTATLLAFSCKDHGADASDIAPTLRAMGHDGSHPNAGGQVAVAFDMRGREGGSQFEGPHDTANIRAASGGSSRSYVASCAVRRLTPRECERLQGFPDDWTLVPYRGKPAADGPRYKGIGNSMAVPVMRWIGERIDAAEAAFS